MEPHLQSANDLQAGLLAAKLCPVDRASLPLNLGWL